MSIDTAQRRGLAIFLLVSAVLLGAAVLDEVSYRQQDADFRKAIDNRFVEQSLKVGAWVMDRKCVANHIGMQVEDLPSYKMTKKRLLELANIPCPEQAGEAR
jgi:hypothetical protein